MAQAVGRTLTGIRLRWQEPAIVGAAGAVLIGAVLPPFVQVGGDLLASGGSLALLGSGRLWVLLARSLGLAVAVTLLALTVGVPLGVLFSRATFPLRKLFFAVHVGIVFLPPFLPALGWFHVFGREGCLGGALSTRLLFSELGVVLVLASCFTPIVTALTAIGVSGVDASLEEAARIIGGPWRAAARVLVPCAAPAIALGGIVVFALAFSELGVPMFLRVDVYPAVVFSRLGGMDFAPGEAAVFALPLVVVALGLLWLERRFAGRRAIAVLGSTARAQAPLFAARPWFLAFTALAAAASVLPLAVLTAYAAAREGFGQVTRWTGDAPWNGIRASAVAAAVMTAVALVLGGALARGRRVGAWLDGLAMLAFILPPSILGVGIVGAWNRPATTWLYASFGILVIGFVARYSAVATRTFAAAAAQIPPSLEDAARTLGAGYIRRLGLVAGLARRGVVATFILALAFALRDLETAGLFYPPGGEPLTVRILALEANGPPAVVSALAVLHVLTTFTALGLGFIVLGKRRAG
jgi:iron(III) transport system permease protein